MSPMPMRRTGPAALSLALQVVEPVWIFVAALLAFDLRHSGLALSPAYWVLIVCGTGLYMLGAGALRLYRPRAILKFFPHAPRLFLALFGAFMVLVAALFMLKLSNQFSRIWLGTWVVVSLVGILAVRAAFGRVMRQKTESGRWALKLGILGVNDKTMQILEMFGASKNRDVTISGVFSYGDETVGEDFARSGLLHGKLKDLIAAAKKGLLDEVIVTLDLNAVPHAAKLLGQLHQIPLNIFYCLPLPLFGRVALQREGFEGLPLALIFKQPMDAYGMWAKRALDVVVSGILLILLAPLLLLVAGAVALESGFPILFRQQRGGVAGTRFDMLKFRSMVANASTMRDAEGKELQAGKADPRITRVGRVIRKTSVDELPQLWNIFKGDMSLVGPRPHALSHDDYYTNLVDRYTSRHRMRPGLTGWAQLHGLRGETETVDKMEKRVEYDIWYTENWSLWLDIKIIFLTPLVVLFQRNAY